MQGARSRARYVIVPGNPRPCPEGSCAAAKRPEGMMTVCELARKARNPAGKAKARGLGSALPRERYVVKLDSPQDCSEGACAAAKRPEGTWLSSTRPQSCSEGSLAGGGTARGYDDKCTVRAKRPEIPAGKATARGVQGRIYERRRSEASSYHKYMGLSKPPLVMWGWRVRFRS